MILHVRIDLSRADVPLFDAYEGRVLGRLGTHGGWLLERFRSVDGKVELHLLEFSDADAFAAFRADPERIAAQPLWERCGATSLVTEVERVDG